MVLPRVLTAVVMIPLVVTILWLGSLPFFLFILAVSLLSLWEYSVMAKDGGYPNQLIMGLVGGALLVTALFLDGLDLWGPLHRKPSVFFIFLVWCFFIFLREFFRSDKSLSYLRIITTISGILLCSFFLGHLLLIRDLRLLTGDGYQLVGREITFFLFFVIWAVDVGAWGIGKLIGRVHMASLISPKKTWEGAIGGTLVALFVGWMFREAFLSGAWSRLEAVVYSLFVAVLAQVSDLTESMIKRSFGVKNSSDILPGHGGILDRFDSFIFSAPFFYYLLIGTGRFQ